jgi:hypothetical protein
MLEGEQGGCQREKSKIQNPKSKKNRHLAHLESGSWNLELGEAAFGNRTGERL